MKNTLSSLLRVLVLALGLSLPHGVNALEILRLEAVPFARGEHITLHFNERIRASVTVPENGSARVIVDVPRATLKSGVGIPLNYRGTLLKDVHFNPNTRRTSELTLFTARPVTVHNLQMIWVKRRQASKLVFDLSAPTASVAAAWQPFHPAVYEAEPRKTVRTIDKPVGKSIAATKPAAVKTELAAKPVIVIDAGHGGQDPGTAGHGGTEEKNITLRFAHGLEAALLKTGRYKVFLTRTDDHYLFLRERVDKARKAGGSLFISLHADSAPSREARGLSVYTISETASDKESAALAAKENKADVIGGMDLSDTSEDVADILIDLAQRETRAKSAAFADLAIKYLSQEVNLLSNTHRFAGFAVLKAPDIPSVLVEVGFLTNPNEEKMLKSNEYEAKVVQALARAVDAYFGKKKG